MNNVVLNKIEWLIDQIEQQEKKYKLQVAGGSDFDSLRYTRNNITDLKEELRELELSLLYTLRKELANDNNSKGSL